MVNRILSAIYFAFAFLVLSLLFSSNAEALDVDLEPINFTFNPDYPLNGEPIEISFEVVNNGNEPLMRLKLLFGIVLLNVMWMMNVFLCLNQQRQL